MEKQLTKYQVIVEFPVQWGEMDAANHVNNLIYLRWSESARIKYFEKVGVSTDFKGEAGPILGWQDCKYIYPVTYPDIVIVGARTVEIREDRFFMECAIFSKQHQRIAAISKQSIIPYSYTALKKIKIPQMWLENIQALDRI